jgi:signal transduction histidine kinase
MRTRGRSADSETASPIAGLAFVCAADGSIRRIARATLDGAALRNSFCDSVSTSSGAECRLFVASLRHGGFSHSAPLRIGERDVHCFGSGDPAGLRIVCVADPDHAAAFAATVEGFADLAAVIRRTRETHRLYEELARLNSELTTSQRELARMVTRLQSLNEFKDELLGMAAHDLRNPLHANNAYIAFLARESEGMTPGARELLGRLQANSGYMLRLIDDVLDFSAIQSGRVRLQREECAIEEILTSVLRTMSIIAAQKEVHIEYSSGAGLPQLRVDRVKISEALHNLVANALQYSPPHATVEVRIASAGGGVSIEVEDRGPGIPPDELPNVFKPFTRLSSDAVAGQRSIGLGLAIARRLVEAHGGTIDVRSKLGTGSLFTLHLPAT